MEANDRSDLGQGQIGAERHADVVPGKAGEHESARPFARAQSESEREDPRGAGRPQEPRQRKSESRKDRETRGQRDHAEGQRPCELLRVDKEGRADPPKPAKKIAEAHPPARAERRSESRGQRTRVFASGRAVDQPHRDGHRRNHQRDERARRQGQCAHRPGYTGDRTSTPPGGLNDVLAKRSDTVHRWGDVGGGCCHRGGSPGRVFIR